MFPYFLLDASLAAFCSCLGILGGWWLKSRGTKPSDDTSAKAEREFAQDVLARVQEVAQSVAKDMGQHSSQVQAISNELAAGGENSSESVMEAVSKLMAANDKLQQQLEMADRTMKSQAEQIQEHAAAANTDALTGLANRRALDTQMQVLVAQDTEECVATMMLCDVDHFKKFNDTHGHLAGDEVLRGVGRILEGTVRDIDFPARYGGEEFAILFPATPWKEAVAIADRVRRAIEEAAFHFEGTDLKVTASMGVAQFTSPESIERWIQRADEGLYTSKEAGRNCGHAIVGDEEFIHFQEVLGGKKAPEAPAPTNTPTEPPSEESTHRAIPTPVEIAETEEPAAASEEELASEVSDLMQADEFSRIVQLRLAEFKRGGSPLSLVVLEIDDLKETIGHRGEECGSVIVKATAQFLQATMRDMDVVSRLDDGRFALLLPSAKIEDALQVAERLRRATARCKLQSGEDEFCVTISLGVTAGKALDSSEKFLGRAQAALSESLKKGNTTYLHDGTACLSSAEYLMASA